VSRKAEAGGQCPVLPLLGATLPCQEHVVAFNKSENILRRAFTTNKSRHSRTTLTFQPAVSIHRSAARNPKARDKSLTRAPRGRSARRRGFFSPVPSPSSFIKGILLDSLLRRILSSPATIRFSPLIISPGIIFHARSGALR
jgi:hypothetical protein